MKKDVKNPTLRIALCSIISALSVVLLLLTAVIPFGTFAVPCMAGLCVIAIVIEYGSKWAFGVFAVVSLLSLFLAGDKESVLFFIALFGHYPIIKGLIESKIKSRVVQYIFKLIVFNVGAIAAFFACTFLLSMISSHFLHLILFSLIPICCSPYQYLIGKNAASNRISPFSSNRQSIR